MTAPSCPNSGSTTGASKVLIEPLWLSQYPPGIPADIDIHEFASLTDVLLASCQRFDDLPAYSNMGTSMSYAELERSSRHFAA